MSHRLQVLIPEALDAQVRKASQRSRLSMGAWVRRTLERALADERDALDPVEKLAGLAGPTGDIDQMLAEIETGRK